MDAPKIMSDIAEDVHRIIVDKAMALQQTSFLFTWNDHEGIWFRRNMSDPPGHIVTSKVDIKWAERGTVSRRVTEVVDEGPILVRNKCTLEAVIRAGLGFLDANPFSCIMGRYAQGDIDAKTLRMKSDGFMPIYSLTIPMPDDSDDEEEMTEEQRCLEKTRLASLVAEDVWALVGLA